jgi:hypothetical protein
MTVFAVAKAAAGFWVMGNSEDYRRNAASCMRLADQTNDPAARAFLLDMARAWHNLANQAERNSRTDLVYETPPNPPQERPVTQQQQQIQPDKDEPKS